MDRLGDKKNPENGAYLKGSLAGFTSELARPAPHAPPLDGIPLAANGMLRASPANCLSRAESRCLASSSRGGKPVSYGLPDLSVMIISFRGHDAVEASLAIACALPGVGAPGGSRRRSVEREGPALLPGLGGVCLDCLACGPFRPADL